MERQIVGITFKSTAGGRYDISPSRPTEVPAPPVPVLDSKSLARRGDPPSAGADRPVGNKYSYTFNTEGTYTFRDANIPAMAGRIVVIPLVDPPIKPGSGSGSGAPTATTVPTGGPPQKVISVFGSRFKPPIVRIPLGTTVKWRNGDRISRYFFGVRFKDVSGVYGWSPVPSGLIPAPPLHRLM